MSRPMGLVLAVMLVLVGRSAHAQMPAPVNGGFGLNYAQTIPSNSYVLDRWWWVQATPAVGAALPQAPVVQPPATVQPADPRRASRAARMGRSFSRVSPRPYSWAGTPLPTGSLYWPTPVSVPLYSPVQRFASYGQGYGVSPYGSADYGAQYKGLYWGY